MSTFDLFCNEIVNLRNRPSASEGDTSSEMYQRGYNNAEVIFMYIPNFKNDKEKSDFVRGLIDGYTNAEKE